MSIQSQRTALLQIAAIGAVVIIVGSVGPWATFLGTSIPGTEGNGVYSLIGGALIAVGVWRAWADSNRGILLGCAAVAFLVAALGVYHYETLQDLVSDEEASENPLAAGFASLVSPGWGLQAMVVGAAAALVGSLAAWRMTPTDGGAEPAGEAGEIPDP